MQSKIILITIFFAVHVNYITPWEIITCESDQTFYDNLHQLRFKIYPILLIKNSGENPLANPAEKKRLRDFYYSQQIIATIVVAADKCVALAAVLNEILSTNKDYPALFILKDIQLWPERWPDISKNSLEQSFQEAKSWRASPKAVITIKHTLLAKMEEIKKMKESEARNGQPQPPTELLTTSTRSEINPTLHPDQITSFVIITCKNDQQFYDDLSAFRHKIYPILLINEANNNPLNEVGAKKRVTDFYNSKNVLALFVVSLDTCTATADFLNRQDPYNIVFYPAFFMLKSFYLMPGKWSDISINTLRSTYRKANDWKIDKKRNETIDVPWLAEIEASKRKKENRARNVQTHGPTPWSAGPRVSAQTSGQKRALSPSYSSAYSPAYSPAYASQTSVSSTRSAGSTTTHPASLNLLPSMDRTSYGPQPTPVTLDLIGDMDQRQWSPQNNASDSYWSPPREVEYHDFLGVNSSGKRRKTDGDNSGSRRSSSWG